MEIASLKDLSFRYPGGEKKALDGISLSVTEGSFVLLCGASGSGKSTLLRQFKSALAPEGEREGSISFRGRDLSDLSEREQAELIGFVGQDPESMIVTDKVWHELAFSLESLGADSHTIRRRTAEMAEYFGISDSYTADTASLSGGQKQLLSLASAMVTRPELLILDEPSARLDPIAARELFGAVRRINRELGTTVIVCEHRLEEVFSCADRVVFLQDGRIAADLSPDRICPGSLPEELMYSLPVPARIWLSAGGSGSCPVSVAEGREWLAGSIGPEKPAAPDRAQPPRGDVSLEVRGLCFRYEKHLPDVLKGISFKAYKGELIGLLGGNGAGKSTLLACLAGMKKAYAGKTEAAGRVLLMPQEPSSLFVHDRLIDDLREMCRDEEEIARTVSLCRLDSLTLRHPFDLSGGELQRAALAKLLLGRPEILLLDEPTKGTDAVFKAELAGILRTVCGRGATVIAVSHDVEFIAEYCGRCAMLFDGVLIGSAPPQDFFSGNLFYTTAASRMARGLIDRAVTAGDVLAALGKSEKKPPSREIPPPKDRGAEPPQEKKKTPLPRKIGKVLCVLLLLFAAAGCMEILPGGAFAGNKTLPYVLLGVSAVAAALVFSDGRTVAKSPRRKRRVSRPRLISAAVTAALIPVTVYAGAAFLDTGKYLFVSLLVMLEASLPFYLLFEGRRPRARELTAAAVMTAAAVAGRIAFYMLPQFKPVLAVVVITGAAFGGQTGFIVGSMSMLLSNFMFGQGPWTPWQMFSMGLVGLLAGVFFERGILPKRREVIAVFGFIAAVAVYGGIVNPSTLFIMHNEITAGSLSAAYAAGFPLDIIHGAASMGFLYALAPAVLKKLERLRVKYGFFE
ncbi:MAG: ATP-binding cassette domain-containing protein [Ruminococcus sp.]|nr:ATP-binding cassette domain-containing protein [Ruminococcus sp.]